MEAIILIGAPGSGKGTTAEGITAATGYIHVATGDMLREAVAGGSAVGRAAESHMKRGALVPDEVIIQLVEERLAGGSPDGCYMFDGFPRTLRQAELLDGSLAKRNGVLDNVFYLDASRELVISRLTGRRTCRECGTNFHVVNIPPKKEGICDLCGGELYIRPDDKEDTIVKRLEVFHRQTGGLISYYEAKGVLFTVDASQAKEEIIAEVVALMRAR